MPPPDLHARFREVLAEEMLRSDLETWMRVHQAEVAKLLAEGDMDWAEAATHFARAGLRVEGRKPDAALAKAAWLRVSGRRARAKR